MHKIIFSILAFKLLFSGCSLSASDNFCVKQNDRNESFGLIWSEEFEGELDRNKWIVSENKGLCDGVFKCYRSENVQTHNGLLILKASYVDGYDGAKLTSKQNFSHGRYEMSLIQPNANLKSCIYTWDPNNTDWRESGRIVLTCNTEPKLYYYRSVYFGKNNGSGDFEALLPGVAQVSENWFHLYGFEWTDKEIRFFFDDTYGNSIQLNDPKTSFLKYFQLRFLIRVSENNPLTGSIANQLDWDCPAFLIDYVRVYEKINDAEKNLRQCSYSNKQYNKSYIDQICQKIKYNQLYPESKQKPKNTESNLDPMIITLIIAILIGLFGIFLFFIIYQYFQINTIKKDQNVAGQENEYEYISDYDYESKRASHLGTSLSPRILNEPAYLSLHDANIHEFVSMNNFPETTHNFNEPSSNLTTKQTKTM